VFVPLTAASKQVLDVPEYSPNETLGKAVPLIEKV
jgi:hypothetical protein